MKQRVWRLKSGIKRLSHGASRLRHFRGHGLHSPYIYKVFREVFMSRAALAADNPIVEPLKRYELSTRTLRELGNLTLHCGIKSFAVNELSEAADMVICDSYCDHAVFNEIIKGSRSKNRAVLAIAPHANSRFEQLLVGVINEHISTSVDRFDYLVFFNNHLPKQHFKL